MSKTLVIAEKPSVGRDLASALPGSYKQSKDKTHLEGDDYVIPWAVGHLVGLAPPDDYDPKLKKWRFADLPILPDKFKLVPNDEKSRRQLEAVHKLIRRAEIDQIVNACDAGREGGLIFAYLYETAGVRKPVKRLWLNSMTRKAIEDAFGRLRDGREMETLEAAARSRSEADWVVGMNATRAASIRLRSAFDGAVSLGRVQTPTLALVTKREEEEEKERPQLLYDLTSLQRHANVMLGFSARRTLAAAQRLYEEHKAITYPRTSSRFLPSDQIAEIKPTAELVGRNEAYSKGAQYVLSLDRLPLGRVVNDEKVDDHHA